MGLNTSYVQTISGYELLIALLTIVLVVSLFYYLLDILKNFGGQMGEVLKTLASGIFLFAVETLDSVLKRFDASILSRLFSPIGESTLRDLLKIAGFFLLVWGFKKLAKIYQKPH